MDAIALRVAVYDEILNSGMPPTSEMLGERLGVAAADVRVALATLNIGKTILPHPSTGEIFMAGPFAAAETPYRVVGDQRAWWANCAWDMFGVAMIVGSRCVVETRCTDCDEPMRLVADPAAPPDENAVVHFLLPARRWYDDIGFT
jgi:hypothetical protein